MPVKDYEAFATTVTQLRLNPPYQTAEAIRRRSGAAAMAAAGADTEDRAAVLLLIGTWERISIMAASLSSGQQATFFRCTPVKLMWDALAPAIDALGGVKAFAPEFHRLSGRYESWLKTDAAKEFRSVERQTVCALFG
ncbi:hypothetical protein QA641_40035 [Bradyrhizobium sp. CB1650]|uniref:hypothetical protein n=1 Tax=Bradyrhizobium sp. CB1650 TaxID=3039153 RepID=UPI002434F3E8|nr:hypothetical protein [Bradyrhizobium sp. CB1650]WGD51561.1 hypothetical protein QA641_40035 [Bradyrhizobium sp. CB1650]